MGQKSGCGVFASREAESEEEQAIWGIGGDGSEGGIPHPAGFWEPLTWSLTGEASRQISDVFTESAEAHGLQNKVMIIESVAGVQQVCFT